MCESNLTKILLLDQAKFGTGTGSSSPSAASSSSSPNISLVAAAQNQAKKKEIVSKAVVGGFTPSAQATEQVPSYNNPAAAGKICKYEYSIKYMIRYKLHNNMYIRVNI